MPQTWEQYTRDEERAHTPSNNEMLEELDAYGHLNWTVGNEDWIACFDAIRHDDRIAYHVVIDCESGGFTDTLESGVIDIANTNAIENLRHLPSYWADICSEQYLGKDDQFGFVDWEKCNRDWQQHLDGLLKEPS
jgi:membrane-bound lytic murein transglycosylase MltF